MTFANLGRPVFGLGERLHGDDLTGIDVAYLKGVEDVKSGT